MQGEFNLRNLNEIMCKACQEYGSPLPSYTLGRYDIMVRFDAAPAVLPFIEDERRRYEISRTPHHSQVTGKVTGKSAIILGTIKANPHITVDQLMTLLSMSNAGVRKIMRQLKSDGLIRRVGSDKNGHWEVIEPEQ